MKKLFLLLSIQCAVGCIAPKKITWIAIGDSITYLNEHLNETGNRVTKGYMTRVTEQLPHISYTNQGHNGWTSGGIAMEIEKLGLIKADVYSIFLGTNDWWQGRPVGSMADYQNNTGNNTLYGSFRIIINKLRDLNGDAKIILITPMQRVDFVHFEDMNNNAFGSYQQKNGQSLEQFATAIEAIGKAENFTVVDLYHNSTLAMPHLVKYKRLKDPLTGNYKNYPYPDFINIPFNPATDEYPYPADANNMTYDGLHPSDEGYATIAKMLVNVMQQN